MRFVILFWLLCFSLQVQARTFEHQPLTELLQQTVHALPGGHATAVNYRLLQQQQAQLEAYLTSLSAVDADIFKQWPAAERLAFLLNAYNAWTLQLILTAYPNVDSIKDLGTLFQSPWQKRFIPLLGQHRSLDEIEHDMIRGSGDFNEPRIHFAVNCASIGCPALREEAYNAATLEQQLEQQTLRFLSDRSRNLVTDERLQLSAIFKWYKEDFQKPWRDSRSLASFLLRYAQALQLDERQQQQLAAGKLPISFLDYDWRLNAVAQ
ncbi:DUF547 domain-containing protein [Alishewanella sp. HL-SH05]|uniref:DUF547 domain-containing protein n=1 Tax=Alishewanella sp. HL-SH05 TaxID=3461145 RepID=UPI00404352F0